ncbi:hypothetical protein KM043_017624 [Ampulex compressa]|nr:hypothetical protein KM043_017624 [Ampulex compressa]
MMPGKRPVIAHHSLHTITQTPLSHCLLLVSLVLCVCSLVLEDLSCDYEYCQDCHKSESVYDRRTIGNYSDWHMASIDFCTEKDVPQNVRFSLTSEEEGTLRVDFTTPKSECKYGVTLLVEPSIQDQMECANHRFANFFSANASIHTAENGVCFVRNENLQDDNSITSLYQGDATLWFEYIFTGCYALQFRVEDGMLLVRGNSFLRTNYRFSKIMKPRFRCKYGTYDRGNTAMLTMDIMARADSTMLLRLGTLTPRVDNARLETCVWYKHAQPHSWIITAEQNSMSQQNCSVNAVQTDGGVQESNIECSFQVAASPNASYCFVIRLKDERCRRNTIWRPPTNHHFPCVWLKRCSRAIGSIPRDKYLEVKTNFVLDGNSYLLAPAVVIALATISMCGGLYLVHRLHSQREEAAQRLQPDSKLFSEEKDPKGKDNKVSKDIVLLYTRGSVGFLDSMVEFRRILSGVCDCRVHDWNDTIVWNEVAKHGGCEWFSMMLKNGSRVIWVDTTRLRALVKPRNCRQASDLVQIDDFKDAALPVILDTAKRSAIGQNPQYRTHFVVRINGLDTSKDADDPFIDLCPQTRYLIPKDLEELCGHLSSSSHAEMDLRLEKESLMFHLNRVEFEK